MASGAKEALQDSSSATMASTSQLQQARQQEAVAGGRCPICLDTVDNAAYVDICFHVFCFGCIQEWAAMTAACPLCRWPFNRILHTVRADNDYQEYVVSSSNRRQRTAARQRVYNRYPQRRYDLRPRPINNEPAAGRRGPAGRDLAVLGDAPPRASDASAQQAAGEQPASPADADGPVRFDMLALQADIVGFMDIE